MILAISQISRDIVSNSQPGSLGGFLIAFGVCIAFAVVVVAIAIFLPDGER